MARSSTSAKFIQRFREAPPLSPDQRRRDRRALEGEFWWTRSGCVDSSLETATLTDDFRTNPVEQDSTSEYAPFFANEEQGQEETENKSLTQGDKLLRKKLSAALAPKPSSPEPSAPASRYKHGQGRSSLSVSFDSRWACPESNGRSRLLPVESGRQLDSPRSKCDERPCTISSQDPTELGGGQADELTYLDERARMLLERCRDLLAAPSTVEVKVDMDALSDRTTTGPKAIAVESTLDTYHKLSHEGLEQRAWTLLNTRQPPTQWMASDLELNTLDKNKNDGLHLLARGRDQLSGNSPRWRGTSTTHEQVGESIWGHELRPSEASVDCAWPSNDGEVALGDRQNGNDPTLFGRVTEADKLTLATEAFVFEALRDNQTANDGRESGDRQNILSSGPQNETLMFASRAVQLPSTDVKHRALHNPTNAEMVCFGNPYGTPSSALESANADVDGRTMNTPVESPCTPSYLIEVGNRSPDSVQSISALMRPMEKSTREHVSLVEYAEDPVAQALLYRAHQIEVELARRCA